MRPLVLLNAILLLTGCATAVSDRPCPRVTEFPREVQVAALEEMKAAGETPNLARMLQAMAADRAFNRAICR